MSWTDKASLNIINKLRDEFKIRFYIETGTYEGINSLVQADNFDFVFTCENNKEYLDKAWKRLENKINVYVYQAHSPDFLKMVKEKALNKNDILLIFLDAHFYNPDLPKEKRFVVLEELEALKDFPNCVIIIHDFWNDKFSGITYDDIKLDYNLVKDKLLKVNPKFKFYTNTICDIYNKDTIFELFKNSDEELRADLIKQMEYTNIDDRRRYRGMLYAIPEKLNLTKFKELKEIDN